MCATIYVLFPPSTVPPIRRSNHEPLPSHRGGLGAENTRQRRPRSQPVFKGPLWVWGILCVAWKVLVARGGRIDHCSSRNSSPNTDLHHDQWEEGNVVLIKVRMPLPRSRYPSLCVALTDWSLEQRGAGFSLPARATVGRGCAAAFGHRWVEDKRSTIDLRDNG